MRPLVLVGQDKDGSISYERRNQCHFDRFPKDEQWECRSSPWPAGTRSWRQRHVGHNVSLANFYVGERWRLRVWSSRDQDDVGTIDDDSTRVEPVVEEVFVLPTEPGWYWAKMYGSGGKVLYEVVQLGLDRYWTESGDDQEWTRKKYAERAQSLGVTFERIPYQGESSEE